MSLPNAVEDLTCDGSFDAVSFPADGTPFVASGRPSFAARLQSASVVSKIPFRQLSVVAAITVGGLFVARVFSTVLESGVLPDNPTLHFLHQNMVTFVNGFGLAVYGCRVNRSLIAEQQRRENLGP